MNHNLNTSERFYGDIARRTRTPIASPPYVPCVPQAWSFAPAASLAWANRMPTSCKWRVNCATRGRVNSGEFPEPDRWHPPGRAQISIPLCLKVLAMFRFVNPSRELHIAGGREIHLGSLQPLGLYVANSVFVGDYLTTRGQAPRPTTG